MLIHPRKRQQNLKRQLELKRKNALPILVMVEMVVPVVAMVEPVVAMVAPVAVMVVLAVAMVVLLSHLLAANKLLFNCNYY